VLQCRVLLNTEVDVGIPLKQGQFDGLNNYQISSKALHYDLD
jgi:hypothetical protein